MLELLGRGVGADYFATNIHGLKHMVLVESDFDRYYDWTRSEFDRFRAKHNLDLTEVFGCSLEAYLQFHATCEFNVFDLDLCNYYYEPDEHNKRPKAPYHLLDKLFKSHVLSHEGLLFTNFQVEGFGPNMAWSKGITPIVSRAGIISHVTAIARKHNYELEVVFDCRYKSTHNNRMHCFGFQVTKL
jgi:hypothetical protein